MQPGALGNGDDGGDSVDSGGRRVDDTSALILVHYLEQRSGSTDIVLIVGEWDLSGFTHSLVGLQYKKVV